MLEQSLAIFLLDPDDPKINYQVKKIIINPLKNK